MVDLTNTTLQRDELELHHIYAVSAVSIDFFNLMYTEHQGLINYLELVIQQNANYSDLESVNLCHEQLVSADVMT